MIATLTVWCLVSGSGGRHHLYWWLLRPLELSVRGRVRLAGIHDGWHYSVTRHAVHALWLKALRSYLIWTLSVVHDSWLILQTHKDNIANGKIH